MAVVGGLPAKRLVSPSMRRWVTLSLTCPRFR